MVQYEDIPLILYYGDISHSELYFLHFMSRCGFDVIYITPDKDKNSDNQNDSDKQDNGQDKENADRQDGNDEQNGQPQQQDKQEQSGEQQPSASGIPEQEREAMLEAIQAQEDKTQDKLKEKQGIVIRGKKNW